MASNIPSCITSNQSTAILESTIPATANRVSNHGDGPIRNQCCTPSSRRWRQTSHHASLEIKEFPYWKFTSTKTPYNPGHATSSSTKARQQVKDGGGNHVISYFNHFSHNFGDVDHHPCDNCSGQNRNCPEPWYCA
ncbi:uncharacterized protein LOC107988863 isoform X2 [Cynoglossus semilaevis]|nr:uncharacterized protein LOC107988863 isoform X2 [Cynoglossus semilaevis]